MADLSQSLDLLTSSQIDHEAILTQPSLLPSGHPPPRCRPCLTLMAEILPTWAPNREMHWWKKNREVGIQACSSGKHGYLVSEQTFHSEFQKSIRSTASEERAPGKCMFRPLLWRVDGASSHRPCTVFLPESWAACRRQKPFVNTVCSKCII